MPGRNGNSNPHRTRVQDWLNLSSSLPTKGFASAGPGERMDGESYYGGTAMTIGKKLYMNFGAVLAMVLVLFLINLVAVQREHSAKAAASQALGLADATDKVRFQMMQNRLYLSNYLLSGDTREVDRMNDGVRILNEKLLSSRALANSDQQRTASEKVLQTEQNWAREFAVPLVEKRKEVDGGNATV